jgi:hypothetical protein
MKKIVCAVVLVLTLAAFGSVGAATAPATAPAVIAPVTVPVVPVAVAPVAPVDPAPVAPPVVPGDVDTEVSEIQAVAPAGDADLLAAVIKVEEVADTEGLPFGVYGPVLLLILALIGALWKVRKKKTA